MAANDNVTVRIVGDASGVQPAVEQTKGSIAGLEPILSQLNVELATLSAQMRESFAAGAAGGHALASGMNEARVATDLESNALTRMVMKVHEGAESVRTFQMRAKEFAELYVAMFGAEMIAHWAESLAEAAEKVEHLAAKTGMTTGEIQGLSGAAKLSGTNIDMLAKGLGMMDNRAVTAAGHSSTASKAFEAMGISANDGSTNMQRLLTIADRFHGMADGPTKAALAMQLFGRSGRDMIPFLNQGSEAIQDLIDKSKEYGAVNEAALEQGVRLAESVNLGKVAWEGLKNVLTEGFGPLLTEIVDGFNQLVRAMVESYNSGGAVKDIFDIIVTVVEGLGQIIGAVADGFASFFSSTSSAGIPWKDFLVFSIGIVVDVFKAVIAVLVLVGDSFLALYYMSKSAVETMVANVKENVGILKADFEALGLFFQAVGKVIDDALHLNWGSIQADWDAGMQRVKSTVTARTNEILAETAHLRQQAKADFNAVAGLGNDFDAFVGDLFAPHAPKHDGIKMHFGGGGGEAPDITSPEKGKKGKEGPSLAEQLEAELEAKKTAWAQEQLAQDTAQQYSLQSEVDFWAQALQRTDLGTKDKLAVEKKYIAAAQALQKEKIQDQLAQYSLDLAAAGSNWDRKLEILRAEQAYVVRMYGAESKEAKAAAQAIVKAELEKGKQIQAINDEIAKRQMARELATVDAAQATAEAEVALGRLTRAKLLDQERQFENQRYQIQRAALAQRLELMRLDPNMDPVKFAQLNSQLEQMDRQHQAKLTQIDRQAVLERTRLERQGIQQISQGWAQAIGQMATLQMTWGDGLKSLWQTLQQAIGNVISSIVESWIAGELSKLVASKATATATISSHAAMAGAGGVASMAAAPFPMDMTAPAFGASMSAAALAFGSINSAAGGDWQVRAGLYNLHENEMVLPSWAAAPLRQMIQGRSPAANLNAPAASNDGDMHLHLHGQIIHSPRDIERWFRDNSRGLGAGMRQFWRAGGNTTANRS